MSTGTEPPRPDMVEWLRSQLDALERAANDVSQHGCDCMDVDCADSRLRDVIARTVSAHRAILDRHEPYEVTAREDSGAIAVLAVCCSYCLGDVTTVDTSTGTAEQAVVTTPVAEDPPHGLT